MNHSQISLKTLVKNIENNHYVTLDFQGRRNFVWDVLDIEKLGDSIIRDVPISSIVTMPVESENFPTKRLNTTSLTSNLKPPSQQYIIDGYQRVASISDIFLGTDSTFLYYFDLSAILNEKFTMNQKSIKEINLGAFCKAFQEHESERFKPRFLLAADVINNKFNNGIGKYLLQVRNSLSLTNREFDDYFDYLTNMLTSVAHYNLAITKINVTEDMASIKRIYEKLNLPLFYQQA